MKLIAYFKGPKNLDNPAYEWEIVAQTKGKPGVVLYRGVESSSAAMYREAAKRFRELQADTENIAIQLEAKAKRAEGR